MTIPIRRPGGSGVARWNGPRATLLAGLLLLAACGGSSPGAADDPIPDEVLRRTENRCLEKMQTARRSQLCGCVRKALSSDVSFTQFKDLTEPKAKEGDADADPPPGDDNPLDAIAGKCARETANQGLK